MSDAQELKEIEVSTLLDGQLQGEELLCVIDLLLADNEARDFYLNSRALDKRLAEVRLPEETEPMPNKLWQGIAQSVGMRNATILPFSRVMQPFVAAAALVFAAVALGIIAFMNPQAQVAADREMVISLEANPEGLTDTEFVKLTRQLLESDRKYHQKMFEIMQIVTTDDELYLPAEGSNIADEREELLDAGEETGPA
jgi:hypothetical protein